jgi:hypothetical protein
MSDQAPNPAPAPGWKPVTPETRFKKGRLYVVLVPGFPAFTARWEPRVGLVDAEREHGEWLRHGAGGPRDPELTAKFFVELPPVPPEVQAEVDRLWTQYYERSQRRERERQAREGAGEQDDDPEGEAHD